MGYLVKDRIFVSEMTAEDIAEARKCAFWLATTYFTAKTLEAFDLGNLLNGYMTAEISTSYVPGQRRIWYYVNKQLVHTQRVDAGQGVRKQAEDFFFTALNRQRENAQKSRVGVTA